MASMIGIQAAVVSGGLLTLAGLGVIALAMPGVLAPGHADAIADMLGGIGGRGSHPSTAPAA